MRFFSWIAIGIALMLLALPAQAERVHVVAQGHTLGKIAKRYHVSVAAICKANDIERRDVIKPGQKLVIPDENDEDGSRARAKRDRRAPRDRRSKSRDTSKDRDEDRTVSGDLKAMSLPGGQIAYYYEPVGPGRLTLRPVLFYLHGSGGDPITACKRWARVARSLGWLVCPRGPVPRRAGWAWANNWAAAHNITMSALKSLRETYGRRVQLYGNTLIGFSEGAYAAMNIGVREPRAFNRWLIIAASSRYLGGPGKEQLTKAHDRLRRIYLITGQKDQVVDETRDFRGWLRGMGVPTRITTPEDMGHELALERKRWLYHSALQWLAAG